MRITNHRLGIAGLLLTIAVSAAPAQRVAESRRAPRSIDDLRAAAQRSLDAWRNKTGAPGATAAVILPDGTAISIASGVARRSTGEALEPDARMFSGSIGKTYVAAVALQLVEEGKLDLDAPISKWLGSLAWFRRLPNAEALTLRMLMRHTSGIAEHVQAPEFLRALEHAPQKHWQPEELLAFVLDKPALFAPDQGWSYADTNYILVGMIVERCAGRAYYEELARRLLKPLKLSDTFASDRADLPRLTCGHSAQWSPFHFKGETVVGGRYVMNPQFEWCGGGLVGTSGDLARWAKLLYAGDVLKPATRAEMRAGVKAATGPQDEYGLGAMLWPTPHGRAIGHSGWFPGYASQMIYYVEKGIAAALQTNCDEREPARGMRAALDQIVTEISRETPAAATFPNGPAHP